MLNDQHQYRYMTVDDMKSLGDDSLKIDVTRDEKMDLTNDSAGMHSNFSFSLICNFKLHCHLIDYCTSCTIVCLSI